MDKTIVIRKVPNVGPGSITNPNYPAVRREAPSLTTQGAIEACRAGTFGSIKKKEDRACGKGELLS